MNEFHWSARGESAEDWLDVKKAHREKAPYPPIKIIFPSYETVKNTVLGEPVRESFVTSPPKGMLTCGLREEARCFVLDDNGPHLNSREGASTTLIVKAAVSSCIQRYTRTPCS